MPVWWLRPFTVGKGGSMSRADARLTPMGRLLMVQRIEAGAPQAHVAAQMCLSRATGSGQVSQDIWRCSARIRICHPQE